MPPIINLNNSSPTWSPGLITSIVSPFLEAWLPNGKPATRHRFDPRHPGTICPGSQDKEGQPAYHTAQPRHAVPAPSQGTCFETRLCLVLAHRRANAALSLSFKSGSSLPYTCNTTPVSPRSPSSQMLGCLLPLSPIKRLYCMA